MTRAHPLTEKLRPHVADLQNAAAAGDAGAQRVINLYRLFVACPADPGAPALCETVFDDWMAARKPRRRG